MIIGVDFDNTIVCYDGLFHKLAVQQGLISPNVSPAKGAVRDYLRRIGQEDRWTELQGFVYGPGMAQARLFPGVLEFFNRCRREGVKVFIISHRTRYPFLGQQHDLHEAAHGFLARHGFNDPARIGLPPDHICFHETQDEKIARVDNIGCTHFIDDLPEVLESPELNESIQRILFDPNGQHSASATLRRLESWPAVEEHLVATSAPSASSVRNSSKKSSEGRPMYRQPRRDDVSALLASAGLSDEFQIAGLPGGGNNRVYRVDCDGTRWLLKAYFHHADDPRDRLNAEFSFSRFVWDCGARCIPQPIARDDRNHLGLYEFIDGRMLTADEIGPAEIDQAAGFFSTINGHELDATATSLPVASEAYFTLADHIDCIDRRVRRLVRLATAEPELNPEAITWIDENLAPAWRRIKDRARLQADACDLSLDEPLRLADRCLSPSDFGFHNAILAADEHLRFIDFEYAGWDDPAKTVCDFICQPRMPVPEKLAGRFMNAVLADCSDADFHRQRIAVLLPVYRLKWCCIMMNEFLPVGSSRRNFACDTDDGQQRKWVQLEKAKQTLQLIEA